MEVQIYDVIKTIVAWSAAVTILLQCPALAEAFADSFDEWVAKCRGRREATSYKHDGDGHRASLLRHGVRNFCMVLLAIAVPAAVLALSLSNPKLFYLVNNPTIVTENGNPASAMAIAGFVAQETLLGVSDVIEVSEIRFSRASANTQFVKKVVDVYRLYMSVFGAVFFYGFIFVLVDSIFLKVKLWPGANKRREPIRINLSGLSRGYDAGSELP